MNSFNERIAFKATKYFGNMWIFWLFCGWAFLPLIPVLLVLQEIRELHKHTHSLVDNKLNDTPEDH